MKRSKAIGRTGRVQTPVGLLVAALLLAFRTNAVPPPKASGGKRVLSPERYSVLRQIRRGLGRGLATQNLSLTTGFVGAGCDVFYLRFDSINFLEPMLEGLRSGSGAYADVWPGGLAAFERSHAPGGAIYQNKHDGSVWLRWPKDMPKPKRDAKSLRPCEEPPWKRS